MRRAGVIVAVAVGSRGAGGGGRGASLRSRRTSCGAVEKNSSSLGRVSCMTVGASDRASEGTESASEGASSSERTSCIRAMSESGPAEPKAVGGPRGPGSMPLPSGRNLRVMMVASSPVGAIGGATGCVVDEAVEWDTPAARACAMASKS